MPDRRPAPAAIGILLVFGFAYSAVATGRGYRALLGGPAVSGPTASVDEYFRPVDLASSELLRQAINRAGWQSSREISLFVDMSSFSVEERDQLSLATSYLLYPTRVVLRSTEEITLAQARGEAPRVIVAGRSNPFRDAGVAAISPKLALAAFR